jgi:cardiolipin synthase
LLPSFTLISAGLLWLAGALTVWTGWQYLMSTWAHFDSPPTTPTEPE